MGAHALPARSVQRTPGFRNSLGTVTILVVGALLFAASFPNVVVRFGAFPLVFVALVPVSFALSRMRWWSTPLYGFFYGFITYALFNYWLLKFHPLAIFIVPLIYATYFAFFFPLLWLGGHLFGRWAFLVQAIIWLAYEWFRIQFYLGYSYGVIGYALFPAPLLIQTAELGGVWIVSFFVVIPSFFLGQLVNDHGWGLFRSASRLRSVVLWRRPELFGYAAFVLFTITWGIVSPVDYEDAPEWDVALIQQNIDPWRGGFRTYERSLDILLEESEKAIAAHDPDAVIWSETSFVPSIDYHTRYRTDQERYELVRRLRDYLDQRGIPFVIGNSDGQLRRNDEGELERVDYNAVLVFNADGSLQGTYRKLHLVPFTEHFPYERQFPWLHRLLVENDTTFWEAGTEWTVFELNGHRFSTPICFEDTFGYLSRGFVRRGSEVIVNLTNDLWSHSEPAAMQHLGMAVFRTVENRRSMVRSTNGGMTAIIDPNGRITGIYPAFTQGYLAGTVPVYTDSTTLYTAWGDWLAWVFVALAAVFLLFGVTRVWIRPLIDKAHGTVGK
ncbi:MAG: apolipoprotein N-acyltransferase [Alkalispirochaeta sp.]